MHVAVDLSDVGRLLELGENTRRTPPRRLYIDTTKLRKHKLSAMSKHSATNGSDHHSRSVGSRHWPQSSSEGHPSQQVANTSPGLSTTHPLAPFVLHNPSAELPSAPTPFTTRPVSVLVGAGSQLAPAETTARLQYLPAYQTQQTGRYTQVVLPDVQTTHSHWSLVAPHASVRHALPLTSPLPTSAKSLSSHGGSMSDVRSTGHEDIPGHRRSSHLELATQQEAAMNISSPPSSQLILSSSHDRFHPLPADGKSLHKHGAQSRHGADIAKHGLPRVQLSPEIQAQTIKWLGPHLAERAPVHFMQSAELIPGPDLRTVNVLQPTYALAQLAEHPVERAVPVAAALPLSAIQEISGSALRISGPPLEQEGHCQGGGELRLSHLRHAGQRIHVPTGCALVGCRSPQLGQMTLLATVDKRYLPDPHTGANVQGFHGNCIGCGKRGFHFFTDFCVHINLRLNTQPKKQKHIRYFVDHDQDTGQLKLGDVIPWKGSSTLLLFSPTTSRLPELTQPRTTSQSLLSMSSSDLQQDQTAHRDSRVEQADTRHSRIRSEESRRDASVYLAHSSQVHEEELNEPPKTLAERRHSRTVPTPLNIPSEGMGLEQQPQPSSASSGGKQQAYDEASGDGSSDDGEGKLQVAVLPCFGHSSAIELESAQDLVVLDILLQPFSVIHHYCLEYGNDPQSRPPKHDPGHEKRAAMVETACILLATFLLQQQSTPILLAEALILHLHRGIQVVDRMMSRPMGVAALLLQLQAISASSNGQLSVCLSRQSLAHGLHQTLKGVQSVVGGGKPPNFVMVMSQRYANDSLGLEVCIICTSQQQVRRWTESSLLDLHCQPGSLLSKATLFKEISSDVNIRGTVPSTGETHSSTVSPLDQMEVDPDPTWPDDLSESQEEAVGQLVRLAQSKLRTRAPLGDFNLVDFVILAKQICPLYVQTLQRLADSPAVDHLLRSRGADVSLASEVARERVICVSESPEILALQLHKLVAYTRECAQTLFIVVADDCFPTPPFAGSESWKALEYMLSRPNILVLSIVGSASSWPAICPLVPIEQCVELVPCDEDDRKLSYHGLKDLLTTSQDHPDNLQRSGWHIDADFERQVQLCLAHQRSHRLQEQEIRSFALLHRYCDSLIGKAKQLMAGHSSLESSLTSKLLCSAAAQSLAIRVPDENLANYIWYEISFLVSKLGLTKRLAVILHDGSGPLRLSFHSDSADVDTHPFSVQQVAGLSDLPAAPSVLVLSGCITGLTLPRSVFAIDYRACAKSQFTQQELRGELGMACGYRHRFVSASSSTVLPEQHGLRKASACEQTPVSTDEACEQRSDLQTIGVEASFAKNSPTSQLPDSTFIKFSSRHAVLSGAMMYAVSAIEPAILQEHSMREKGKLFLSAVAQLQPEMNVRWHGGHERPPYPDEDSQDALSFYRRWTKVDKHHGGNGHGEEPHTDDWSQMIVLYGPPQSGKTAVYLHCICKLITAWCESRSLEGEQVSSKETDQC